MPTYEYACKGCGTHIEVVQAFSDDSLTTCATCGGDLRKVFGSVGISFKGSGFYKTDSRGNSESKSGESKSGDTKTDSPSTEKSDKKDSTGTSTPAKSESSSTSKPSISGSAKAS